MAQQMGASKVQAVAKALLHYLALAITITLLLLPRLTTENGAHGDTTRDLCMARDCATDEVCPMAGADTSYPGIRQSALWPVHLAAQQQLGLDVDGMRDVALVLLLTAFLGLAMLGEAIASRFAGFVAALLAALVHLQVGYWLVLWNPSFILLPCVACFGAIAIAAYSRHWLPLLAAAFFFVIAIALHPIASLMVIAFPWVVVLLPPKRPVRTLVGMLTVAGVTFHTFFRDGLVALYREVQTGAMSDSLTETSEQVLPTTGIVIGGLLLIALLTTLWWLQRHRRGPLGRWLNEPTSVLLLAALSPGSLALLVLLVTDRFYGYRYLVAPLPGFLVGVALAIGWVERWLATKVPNGQVHRQVRSWALPLALLVVALLLPGVTIGSRQPPPRTWSYADGEVVAKHLISMGVTDFNEALEQVHGPDLPLLMYALRPYLPESASNSEATEDSNPSNRTIMVASVLPLHEDPPDGGLPEEWFVYPRANGSDLYVAPVPRVFRWSAAQVRLLGPQSSPESVPFLPVEIGGYASTYAPWVRPTGGQFEAEPRILQLKVPLLPVEEPLQVRPLPDCRCPEGESKVVAVEGLEAELMEDGGAHLKAATNTDTTATITVEWRAADNCPPLDIEQGGPSILAWAEADERLGRFLRRAQCP